MSTKAPQKKKLNLANTTTFDDILKRRGPQFYKKHKKPGPKIFLALNLLHGRLDKGWTQVEMAKRAGLSFNTYVNIEQAQVTANPTVDTLIKLADCLGLGISELWKERELNF